MHRTIEPLIGSAQGTPVRAVVLFVDVRGFSEFCRRHEVDQVVRFVRCFYRWTLDAIGTGCRLWRSTGDGMLIVFTYTTDEEEEKTTIDVVQRSLRACEEFGAAMASNPSLHFRTPSALGIGIARGSSLCLLGTPEYTLDVCGVVVNRAARLLDQARPSGVVVDAGVYATARTTDLAARFVEDSLYLPGVSEDAPVPIAVERERVVIDPSARQPRGFAWRQVHTFKRARLSDLAQLASPIGCRLSESPPRPTDFVVMAMFPARTSIGQRLENYTNEMDITAHATYESRRGIAEISVAPKALLDALRAATVQDSDPVTLEFWTLCRAPTRSAPAARPTTQRPLIPPSA